MRAKRTIGYIALLTMMAVAASQALGRPKAQTKTKSTGSSPQTGEQSGQQTRQQTEPHASETKNGFGKPEAITGTILIVEPGAGLVILARRGPTEPPSTVLQENGGQVTALNGPGQTNYSFRITGSTVIKVGGKPATLADLGKFENKQATVQFIPRRDGNFATSIELSQ